MTDYFGSNDVNDVMYYTNNDRVWGFDLDDKLSAGVMYGGNGNDTYVVDSPSDLVVELPDQGMDRVISTIADYALPNNVEYLNLFNFSLPGYQGFSTQNGTGNSLDNAILGNSARNVLRGMGGSDLLEGQGGNDDLYGGQGEDYIYGTGVKTGGNGEIDNLWGDAGADRFFLGSQANDVVFYARVDAVDDYAVIKDFELNVDKVVLHGTSSQYQIGTNPYGSGVGIYYKTYNQGPVTELIGIIEGSAFTPSTVSINNTNIFSFG